MGIRLQNTSALLAIAVFSLGVLSTLCAIEVDLDEIQKQFPTELTNGNLTDKAKSLFKDKCRKVAGNETGNEAYASIEQGLSTVVECVSEIVNMTAITAEIEKARPNGDLDTVFNKYCKKRPDAMNCLRTLVDKVEPCLEQDEKENSDVLLRIFESLLNFVCHKGGDQIALFIAERGPECLESKKDQIQHCMNKTFGEYLPKENPEDIESLPKFIIGAKECDDIQSLNDCIVAELEKCDEITPANIVESMFRFIKNETICRNELSTAHQKSSAMTSALPNVLLAVIGLLMTFMERHLRI